MQSKVERFISDDFEVITMNGKKTYENAVLSIQLDPIQNKLYIDIYGGEQNEI